MARRYLLGLLLVGGAGARAVEPARGAAEGMPPAVEAWADRLEAHYGPQGATLDFHYGPPAPAWPLCPSALPGGDVAIRSARDPELSARFAAEGAQMIQRCQALTYSSWELWVEVKPSDQRAFAPVVLRITHLPDDRDPTALLEELPRLGARATRDSDAAFAVGRDIVELHTSCKTSVLLTYEVGELVAALDQPPSTPASDVSVSDPILWSPCAVEHFERRDRAWLAEQAAEPRTWFGLSLPEARVRKGAAPGLAP